MAESDSEPVLVELGDALKALDQVNPRRLAGRVTEITGLVVRATTPGVRVGELVTIDREAMPGLDGVEQPRLQAEVVGFRGDEVVLMPLGEVAGIGPDAVVSPSGRPLRVRVGQGVLGRVLDGLGEPLDGQGPIVGPTDEWAVDRPAPDPLTRRRVAKPLALGVRAIDAFLTVGEGQRVGLFAGSGVGKSTLLGQIARQTEAEVNVIALVGERGREVTEFIEDALGPEGRARSVVICATSDAPSLVRLKSAFVATAVAEWFRDRGQRVLLMMDSLTRFARAQLEVGLAAGEPPARQGFPPSVFALLPRLLERTGNSNLGSITALYAVLVSGGDMEEPIADEVRGILMTDAVEKDQLPRWVDFRHFMRSQVFTQLQLDWVDMIRRHIPEVDGAKVWLHRDEDEAYRARVTVDLGAACDVLSLHSRVLDLIRDELKRATGLDVARLDLAVERLNLRLKGGS